MNRVKFLCGFLIFTMALTVVGCSRSMPEKDSDQETNQTESVPTEDSAETSVSPKERIPKRTQVAQERMENMTLEEKVAQMFFVRVPEESAAQVMEEYQFGGYLMFGRDFKGQTKESVIASIANYQAKSKTTAFIGVDEEGGTVNRISVNPEFRGTPFLSPAELFQRGGFDAIDTDTEEKTNLLLSLGINVNFAPVCDVPTTSTDFIFQRAFSTNVQETVQYVSRVVKKMKDMGLASTLKHFPGYGNNVDTHTGVANDKRPIETFQTVDFLPFKAGIDAGTPFVLVSHNIVESMDATLPASLSKNVHDILRNELGFQNLIITDDLSMDAITAYTGDQQAAVLAVEAGNDMICCTNYQEQITAVVSAVQNGQITEERIEESVLRILALKYDQGLIQ